MRYTALIDGKSGAYGVVIPDIPGCTAMGATIEEALANAAEALRDFAGIAQEDGEALPSPRAIETVLAAPDIAEAVRSGATLASVPLIRASGKPARANLSIDSGVLQAIDAEARRRKLTRSGMIEVMARQTLSELA